MSIDINNKIFYFGFGDILVNSCEMPFIRFTGIVPPLEIGTVVDQDTLADLDSATETIEIKFDSLKEAYNFKHMLERVSIFNSSFEYGGYTFDFSNYNELSIQVLLTHINSVITSFVRLMAC